ncbi:MAG: calcium-binding protein [Gemmobacter sp.]|nr:calcium-binding protein [Gemmobacter sp.]
MSLLPIPVGGEDIVHPSDDNTQYVPIVQALAGGGHVVVWTDADLAAVGWSGYRVMARFFGVDGAPLGASFVVSAGVAGGNPYLLTHVVTQTANVTQLDNGSVLVAWGGYGGISARLFGPDGSVISPAHQVLQVSTELATRGQIAIEALDGGGFAIASVLAAVGDVTQNVWLRRYDDALQEVGDPVQISMIPEVEDTYPAVARYLTVDALEDGRVVSTWVRSYPTLTQWAERLEARVVDADGVPLGGVIDLRAGSSAVGAFFSQAVVTALPGGGFVAFWGESFDSGLNPSYGVNGRVFDADGVAQGDVFRPADDLSGYHDKMAVTAMQDGGFVVVWTHDTLTAKVVGQRYDARGEQIGPDFLVSTETSGGPRPWPSSVSVDTLADGGFVVAWTLTGIGGFADQEVLSRSFMPQTYGTALSETMTADVAGEWMAGLAGNDTLTGNVGHDTLHGGDGVDVIYGGAGDDLLSGDGGRDTLFGGLGNDELSGGDGLDVLDGGVGDDLLWGGAGGDSLIGGGGNDSVFGGDGNDTIDGNSGADLLDGDAGHDVLYGGAQADTLFGGAGVDQLFGGSDADVLYGGHDNDVLNGGDDHDLLFGGDGNDRLLGATGNDTLIGGLGADRLLGGEGADVFRFDSIADSTFAAGGRDTIVDFEVGIDKLDLSAMAPGLVFIGGGFTGVAGQVRYNALNGLVMIDIDGDRLTDSAIKMQVGLALTGDDFLF